MGIDTIHIFIGQTSIVDSDTSDTSSSDSDQSDIESSQYTVYSNYDSSVMNVVGLSEESVHTGSIV